jgi:hypothetical protein
MDARRFVYRIFVLDQQGDPIGYAGCGFPINAGGDLVTCEHVAVQYAREEGEKPQQIVVHDAARDRFYTPPRVETPDWPDLDLAVIPRAFGNDPPGDYLPILDPGALRMGEDVFTIGHYTTDGRLDRMRVGEFKGSLVSIERGELGVNESRYRRLLLTYPVIEGMSGSPVLSFHTGVKAVGVCFGNESLGVKAYEVIEGEEDNVKYREELKRIVEYGLAHPPDLLSEWLQDAGFERTVLGPKEPSPEGLIG